MEQDTLIKWKTLYNKSCRSCFIESRTVEFVFFWFFYYFISILQVCCLMRPGHQDLNVIFLFTFRSCRPARGRQAPCRPGRGRQGYSFEIFRNGHIFLKFYFFKKYKKEKTASDRAFLGFCRKQQWLAGRVPFGRAQHMGVAAFESTFAFFFLRNKAGSDHERWWCRVGKFMARIGQLVEAGSSGQASRVYQNQDHSMASYG